MLGVEKNVVDGILKLKLTGTVDEQIDLQKVLGPPAPVMHLDCQAVERINSIGVKNWRSYFTTAREAGTKFRFSSLSPVMVEQMNFVEGFIEKGEVESLCMIYYCLDCKADTAVKITPEELVGKDLQGFVTSCQHCRNEIEFDELPEEYFSFLLK